MDDFAAEVEVMKRRLLERSRIAAEICSRPPPVRTGPPLQEEFDAESEAEYLALRAALKTRKTPPRQFPDGVIDLTKHKRCKLPPDKPL